MLDSVLQAAGRPEVTFDPRHRDGHLDDNGNFQAKLEGVLTLQGAGHDAVIETQRRLDGDRLIATGHLSISYVKWGLKDPSVLFLT